MASHQQLGLGYRMRRRLSPPPTATRPAAIYSNTTLVVHQRISRRWKPDLQPLQTAPSPHELMYPAKPLPGHLFSRSRVLSISETFAVLKEQGKMAFVPYVTAGDPDLWTTAEALKILDACGSDVIELGIPCPDPRADGPVIQAAAARALANGANIDRIVSMLKKVIPQISCPITVMVYHDSITNYGTSNFLGDLSTVGVRGLIVPDLPPQQVASFTKKAKRNGIELVLITTPTTPTEQMKATAETSQGFLYLASHNGATGARPSLNPDVEFALQRIRTVTSKPIAVGFGISKPEHVAQLSRWGADGVIVGSAIVKRLGEAESPGQGLERMEAFVTSLSSVR